MPGQFRSKAGATLAGHSDKWSDENRRHNSHAAGQGSRGSRNQGTGAQGKANTVASQGIDTSKMKPEEKLRYFNSLGLLGPKSEPEIEVEPPKHHQQAPVDSKTLISNLREQWSEIFGENAGLMKGIISTMKQVPPAKFKKAAQAAYRATAEITAKTDDIYDIQEYIQNAINEIAYQDL